MTCYYQNHQGVRGYRLTLHAFWKEKELFQVGVVSSANYLKERLAATTTIRGDKKTCRKFWNNNEAQQKELNRTGTEPIQQVTEQYIAQEEEGEVRGKKNPELLIKYNNTDTVEKQNIFGKTVELMRKDNLPNPQNLRRIDRVRLKENSKLADEVIDSVKISNITEDNKLVKSEALVIAQLLEIKEIKDKKKEEPF